MFRGKVKYLFIVLVIALVLTSAAYAKGGPPGYGGRWVGYDEVDGSDVYLTLGGPPKGPYNVHWRESFFSLCGSRRGRGRGTAEVVAGQLIMDIDFVCFQTPATAVIHAVYDYDPSTNTLFHAGGDYTGVLTFYRPYDY